MFAIAKIWALLIDDNSWWAGPMQLKLDDRVLLIGTGTPGMGPLQFETAEMQRWRTRKKPVRPACRHRQHNQSVT